MLISLIGRFKTQKSKTLKLHQHSLVISIKKSFGHKFDFLIKLIEPKYMGAGATFDWLFFDNSKLTDFDC